MVRAHRHLPQTYAFGGCKILKGRSPHPPGPTTALPYTWGVYYIKLNNSVLLKPKIAFSTDFFSRGPKIAVDELRVHTLVQIVQEPKDFSFCVEIVLNHGPSASTSAPDVCLRGVQNFEGPESRPPRSRNSPPLYMGGLLY